MRHWNATDSFPEFLGVSIALAKPKLMHFARFFEKQFPRSDVSVGISCMFHGFREPHFDVELPTKEEFLDGAQYFITGEHSLTFSIRK
jgi:hypothetical protein